MEDDRIVGMHFAMGDKCGHTDRKVDVSCFVCYVLIPLMSLVLPLCSLHFFIPVHLPSIHHTSV